MKAPTPKEHQDQETFAEIVRRTISPGWMFTHVANGEVRDIRVAMKLQRMGVNPGFPDFIFVGPNVVFFLELKRRSGGALMLEQMNWRDHIIRNGHAYLCTNRIEEAIDTLVDLGITRRVEVSA